MGCRRGLIAGVSSYVVWWCCVAVSTPSSAVLNVREAVLERELCYGQLLTQVCGVAQLRHPAGVDDRRVQTAGFSSFDDCCS